MKKKRNCIYCDWCEVTLVSMNCRYDCDNVKIANSVRKYDKKIPKWCPLKQRKQDG